MEDIGKKIVLWFRHNKRELPWRKTSDPYLIWISEIILQQTQVATGIPYYKRIVERFPNVTMLASASEDELLNLWQGLGYYSRARNMHAAAKQVVDAFGGRFPADYKQLLLLKGVGEYTAAAIASQAFGLPHAAVDGNVYRVLSRLFAINTPIDSALGKKVFSGLANDLLNKDYAGDYNQGMMELGATVCKPVNSDCHRCPLCDYCEAFRLKTQHLFPVKAKKTSTSLRYLNYYFVQSGGKMAIRKRQGKDIWRHLYDFPMVESPASVNDSELIENFNHIMRSSEKYELKSIYRVKHLLTHQQLHLTIVHVYVSNLSDLNLDGIKWVKVEDWHQYTFPQPLLNYLKIRLDSNS